MEAPFCLYFSSFGQMIRPIIDSMSVRPTAASGTSSVSHSSSASSSSTTGPESIFEPRDTSSANQTAAGRRGQPDGWSVCFKWAYFGTSIYRKAKGLAKLAHKNELSLCQGFFHVFYYYWGEEYRSTTTFSYNDKPWLFLCFTFFSVAQKGEGERRERTIRILLHLSLPLISHLSKRCDTEISCCFHSYLFLLAHRPLLSISKVNGTFMKAFLAGQMYV